MILQYHVYKTLSMIFYTEFAPNALSHVILRHPRSCLLCFFDNSYISPLNSQNFLFTCLCSFLHTSVLEEIIQAELCSAQKMAIVAWGIQVRVHGTCVQHDYAYRACETSTTASRIAPACPKMLSIVLVQYYI